MDLNELGFLAIRNGDFQEAVNIFRKAFEKGEEPRSFTGFGLAHYSLGDYQTARWALSKALELEPRNEKALEYLKILEQKGKQKDPPTQRGSLCRVGDHYLEILKEGRWRRFFVKGMNLGLGLPGYFPGEYPVLKGTYLKWFRQIADLGVNSLRIYTVHPPCFYEALAEFNQGGKKLWLFQGIWAELPEDGDFDSSQYLAYIKQSIRDAVDVVHGAASLPEKPGYAHGSYAFDVSSHTAAFVFGREWEPCAVKHYNLSRQGKTGDWQGEFLGIAQGTAFECWVTRICDYLLTYEHGKFSQTHPLSVANWPTLDPLSHPSESNHEDELLRQGLKARTNACNENEDMASLDVAKISVKQGSGFFATYHVYPYYPDFINNDYLDAPDPYRAYLHDLKKHHGSQPVLIAEFGLPSSREVTHWQRDGLHHGGHDEKAQGEGNGRLMQSVFKSGMAGGMLFSWFDEWFKRNWLFLPYEIPAERKPLWFNLQDAEENYGLLAAYPGYPRKLVSLSGKLDEWSNARTLYQKDGLSVSHRFNDGFDASRTLRRLLAQHDEGFLYLLLETAGPIDFTKAGYMIGLDTCSPESGEFLLPLETKLKVPVGMKFVMHFSGERKSRLLVCKGYDKYLNYAGGEIIPGVSDRGEWVVMQNRTNSRRISKDGSRFYPSRVFSMSNLRFGSLEQGSPRFDSLADFHVTGSIIEIRIPWGLVNFTDPGSRTVLWQDGKGKTRITDGIRCVAVSFKPEEGFLYARDTGLGDNATDTLPASLVPENIRKFSWDGWNVPLYHTYLKQSYHLFRKTLAGMPDEI